MNHLFTIICEYKGGTYTRQLHSTNPQAVLEAWAKQFQQEGILNETEQELFAEEMRYSLEESNLIPLQGLQNIWYEGFSLADDLLEIMVVGTQEQPIEVGQRAATLRAA